jgi:adenylate cyclase
MMAARLALTPRRLASLLSAAATLGVTLLLSWALVAGRTPEALQRLDLLIYDAWVRHTAQPAGPPRVTVLELDEASLDRLGQWPWPRDRIAQVVRQVFDTYGAQALAFDIVFAEPDRSDAAAIQQRLQRVPPGADSPLRREFEALLQDLDRDRVLAGTLQGRNVVLGYYFNADPASRTGALPEPWLPAEMAQSLGIRALSGPGYGANLEQLVQAARRAGHFNPRVDLDGVTRSIPLVQENDGMLYTSLTLGVLSLLAGDNAAIDFGPAVQAGTREVTEALTVGPFKLPVDDRGQGLVPFFGGRGSLPRVSVADLLEGKADPALLKGRVVVFGPTAPGLKDSRSTPVDNNQPGVELHASYLQGALTGQLPSRPYYTDAAVLSTLGLVGLIMLAGARGLRPLPFTLVSVVASAAVLGGAGWLWVQHRAVLPVALPLTQIATLFVGLNLLGYLFEARSKNAMNKLFGQYVPPELVGEMNENPGQYSMSAKSTELTVMFADVRGFTTLSEKMEPAALGELMNTLLTELSRVIRADHLGTIDKYIGDCVMAFWGAPIDRPDHAAAATAAALDMQKALTALLPRLVVPEGAHIAVGIGLNTGKAVVGNMGSAYRMAYTVLGDTVNTASRLEGLTKAYGADIVVGPAVRAAAGDGFLWCELDWVRVKGRDTPLAIHEPLCRLEEADATLREQVARHERALVDYRERRFQQALDTWTALQAQRPCKLHELWIERARTYLAHPPAEGWDGVYTFETK